MDAHDTFLVLTFAGETRVLGMNTGGRLLRWRAGQAGQGCGVADEQRLGRLGAGGSCCAAVADPHECHYDSFFRGRA